jgi:hypothetical protein
MSYSVTAFDVCAQGFERLRSYEEFIVVAAIDDDSNPADLLEQWEADLQSCDRPENFDFDAAREAIRSYYESNIRPLFDRKTNPFDLEPARDDILPYDQGCNAYLFIRVDNARFEVWDCDSIIQATRDALA